MAKQRKTRSDKGKPRKPYQKKTPAEPSQIEEPKPQAIEEVVQTLEDIYNHDDVLKEFTAYEPPSESEPTNETDKTTDNKEKFIEDDWLEDETGSVEDETEPNEYKTEGKDYVKYAIRTIKKFDLVRALGFSIFSGESLKKYLEFKDIKENDDIVKDTAEVLEKYDIEMKPEYALLSTVLMGTVMIGIQANEDRKLNKTAK